MKEEQEDASWSPIVVDENDPGNSFNSDVDTDLF